MNPDRYTQVTQNVYIDRWGMTAPQTTGRRTLIVKLLLWLIPVGLLMPVMSAAFTKARDNARRASCYNNLEMVALGVMQYVQDNDDRYPLAEVNDVDYSPTPPYNQNYGWADALYPYLKSTAVLHCPTISLSTSATSSIFGIANNDGMTPPGTNPSEIGFTDYWLNRNVCGLEQQNLTDTAETFLLGDGNTGRDATTARYTLRALPGSWETDENSPAHRHLQANYAYLDGHVKSFNVYYVDDPHEKRQLFTPRQQRQTRP